MTSAFPKEIDSDDLRRAPVREPQPSFVPAGRLDHREAIQEHARIRSLWVHKFAV